MTKVQHISLHMNILMLASFRGACISVIGMTVAAARKVTDVRFARQACESSDRNSSDNALAC